MGETSTALLLGGVIVLILAAVAIFVGILAYMQRGQAKKRAQEEASRPQLRLPATPATVAPEQPPPLAEPPVEAPAAPGEVMRVVRDERTGRVLVEVGGQRYTHIREIKDAQVGRRVLWAIADLVRFTGGMATNPQAVRSAAQERNGASPDSATPPLAAAETLTLAEPPAPSVPPATPAGAHAGAAVSSPPATRAERPDILLPPSATANRAVGATDTPPAERRGSSVLEFFRRGFQAPVVTPAANPSSFIDEIEAILQQRISSRAAPLPYEVHVKTGPFGKLQIEVGPNNYGSPEQIPDPEIRELIRAAVAEWERR